MLREYYAAFKILLKLNSLLGLFRKNFNLACARTLPESCGECAPAPWSPKNRTRSALGIETRVEGGLRTESEAGDRRISQRWSLWTYAQFLKHGVSRLRSPASSPADTLRRSSLVAIQEGVKFFKLPPGNAGLYRLDSANFIFLAR